MWTTGARTTAFWWYWSNFLTLRQRLHILHVAGIHICFSWIWFWKICFQHQFRISYRIILREKELHLNIGVYNPSKVISWDSLSSSILEKVRKCFFSQETPFDFNVLLHSYFKCPDVRRCQVNPCKSTAAMISKILNRYVQVTGLNGVNFLDRTRTPLEGPHPGLPPQVCAISSESFSKYLNFCKTQNKSMK